MRRRERLRAPQCRLGSRGSEEDVRAGLLLGRFPLGAGLGLGLGLFLLTPCKDVCTEARFSSGVGDAHYRQSSPKYPVRWRGGPLVQGPGVQVTWAEGRCLTCDNGIRRARSGVRGGCLFIRGCFLFIRSFVLFFRSFFLFIRGREVSV